MTDKRKLAVVLGALVIFMIGFVAWYNSPTQKLHRCVKAQETNGLWFPATVHYEHYQLVFFCQQHLDNWQDLDKYGKEIMHK